MKQDEPELIARSMDDDEQAYAILVNRYKQGLYHHCFNITHDEDLAEDIALDAFVEAFLHLDRYDSRFRFSTWLYKIATNLALMHMRKRHDVRMDEDELDRIVGELPDGEQFALYRELHEAVDTLPVQYRTVVTMHYWQGKSYREIASSMGTTVGSVKGWMSRARKQLKEVLS